MAEEKNLQAEEQEVEELELDDLDEVAGGAMNRVHVNKTKDITDSMKSRA